MTKCFFFFRPILENFFWKEPDTVVILSGFVGQGGKTSCLQSSHLPGGLTRWWAHFAPSCHQLETFSGWRASGLRRRPLAGQWAATGVSFTFCPSDILVPAFLSSFPENLAISTWVADWRQVTSFCHWLLDWFHSLVPAHWKQWCPHCVGGEQHRPWELVWHGCQPGRQALHPTRGGEICLGLVSMARSARPLSVCRPWKKQLSLSMPALD